MPAPKSLKDRVEAAMAYLMSGMKSEKAASMLGNKVAARTIREWTETEWWPDVMAKAKLEKQDELDSAMTGVIHKGMENISERLEKGDPYVKKDQSIGFKPIGAKDNALVVAIMSDKRSLIRGEPTRRTETIRESDRLAGIKKELAKPLTGDVKDEKSPKGLENLH